ncbi:alpha/beta hydrolase [Saxibacter everestensis]|uniref:Alpha/beta hydrolase n=1 Tax=Saxibacter everestensis TaxID=2909229 RepID=A0ABY8QW50_9MICO|nr:alpha/beta hydrolase [Brevibacteriaceae bacterium ZFBP1038]
MTRVHHVGKGSGTPLLMIHGFCVDHRLLLSLEPLFEPRTGWRRIYVDLPGMGHTVAGPEIDSADAVAASVVDFVRAEIGDQRFAVLGNSFGGLIARHVASVFGDQVAGLALLCPVVISDAAGRTVPPRSVVVEDADLLSGLDPDDAAEYADIAVIQSAENFERFRTWVLPGLRCRDRRATARIAGRYSLSRDPEASAPAFGGPVVFITGRRDHVVGYSDVERLLEHYPQAVSAVLEDAGHNAHLDQPERTETLLGDWLDRVELNVGATNGLEACAGSRPKMWRA